MIIKNKNKLKLESKSKILVLGLILIILVGFFSPINRIRAQNDPVGTCTNTVDGTTTQTIQSKCSGLWETTSSTQADKNYHLLAPLPDPNNPSQPFAVFDPTSKDNENSKLGEYLNLMIKIFIGLCAVLAVIMIVIGGIEYMTSELISSKEAGKERITHAVLGLLVALGAYALLNTINPDILKTDLKSLTSQMVSVDLNSDIPQEPVNGMYGMFADGADWTTLGGNTEPLPYGVSVSNSACTRVGQRSCTSIQGLRMDAVRAIQEGCRCNIQISGGTEYWLHGGTTGSTSHRPGSSTIDLRPTPELNQYLSGGRPLVNMTRYPPTNALYEVTRTGSHWHVGP